MPDQVRNHCLMVSKPSCVWTPIRKQSTMYSPNMYIYSFINYRNILLSKYIRYIIKHIQKYKQRMRKKSTVNRMLFLSHTHMICPQHPMEHEYSTLEITVANNEKM